MKPIEQNGFRRCDDRARALSQGQAHASIFRHTRTDRIMWNMNLIASMREIANGLIHTYV